jgi:hypothetical protein
MGSNARPTPPGAIPETRIVRSVDITAPGYTGEWNNFLNEAGQLLYGDGNVKALGSMAVTYVSANEIGRMLSDRYPDAYSGGCSPKTRRQIIMFERKIGKYIADQERTVTQMMKKIEGAEVPRQAKSCDDAFFDDEHEDELGKDEHDKDEHSKFHQGLAQNKLWHAGVFAVRGVEPYGRTRLGFDLTDPENEALRIERRQLVEDLFKKELKLNTRLVDPYFDPHVSFFVGNQPVAQMIIPNLDSPLEIVLQAPKAIANLKK